jgi:photosystem II stability/assembly factor-like uncharacterized protein
VATGLKTFRRPLLDAMRNRSGYVAQAQQMQRDIRDLQRAPVRIPATQVVVPKKKPAPMTTPVDVIDIFYPGFIYRIASDTWETIGNDGDEFLPPSPVAGIIGKTLYRNSNDGSFWRSDDRGATWSTVTASGELSGGGDGLLDVHLAPDGTFWAYGSQNPPTIYKSSDADTWVASYVFSGSLVGIGLGALAVSPTDSNRIAACAFDPSIILNNPVYVVTSDDGGATWSSEIEVSSDTYNGQGTLAWFGNSALALILDETKLSFTRNRIYVSDDDGATWSNVFENTSDLTFSGAMTAYEAGVLVLGAADKAFRTTDGSTFAAIFPPVGGGGSPRISGIVLVNGTLYTLTDDGSFYAGAAAKTSAPLAPSGFTTPLVQI